MLLPELQKTCSSDAHSASVQTRTTTAATGRLAVGVANRAGACSLRADQLTGGSAGVLWMMGCRVIDSADLAPSEGADSRARVLLLIGVLCFMLFGTAMRLSSNSLVSSVN